MRHPSPPFLRTLNTMSEVRFARVFRAANCCCAVSRACACCRLSRPALCSLPSLKTRAVLAAVSQDPRCACCRLSRPALCLLPSLKTRAVLAAGAQLESGGAT